MTPAELQEHIYKTYFWLRGGLCLLAFVFPFLLWGTGSWNEIPLQNSISDYYFAFAPPNSELRAFPGRVVFVGVLFALGFFLILYRGFSKYRKLDVEYSGLERPHSRAISNENAGLLHKLCEQRTFFLCALCGCNRSLCLDRFCCLGLFRGNVGPIA